MTWTKIGSEYVIDNAWLKVRKDAVRLPNDQIVTDYYVVEKNDVALVVLIDDRNRILLKKEYRYPIDRETIELPGGTFDSSVEEPQTAAVRELLEETGYTADEWTLMSVVFDYPTKDTNKLYLFQAKDIRQRELPISTPSEDIKYRFYEGQEVVAMIQDGTINVSGTIAGDILVTTGIGQ